ncbi:phosphinothricin acetyltransferase [Burkholderia pyrrocinia]|uniref:Phosphinothricin acetyltransferase n=1 Tax=Burkholderia pyrrocinia TaxID=60550 RepID=A0A318JBP6_BURPY|nr:phosphinothricin acetyltransferase [Burkholderia pyrrocinia]SFW82280.1 phosphinothricin acetyltransferase [Burkholderia sp. NFACC33-1]SFY44059.1 phosphinothricin acetyltransferase [Burkholderia sp. NFPP32]
MPDTPAACIVRDSTEADLAAIHAIYAHHVRHGVASFEETPPDAAELRARRDAVLGHGLPYLVAKD